MSRKRKCVFQNTACTAVASVARDVLIDSTEQSPFVFYQRQAQKTSQDNTHKTPANTPRGHMYREHSGCILTLLRIHPPLSSFNTQPDICLILILTKNNRLINISISPFTSRTSNALLLNCHILRSDHTHANQLYRWIVILSFYPWAHSLSLSFSLSMSVP